MPCPGGDRRLPDGTPAIWALSWAEVELIRERLNRLNPYDRSDVPDLFKLEDENYGRAGVERVELHCVAIGPKRYTLAEIAQDGSTAIRRASRHGLGYFMAPTVRPTFEEPDKDRELDWSEVVWRRIVDEVRGIDPGPEPEWFSTLAPSRDSITRWNRLEPYRRLNAHRRYPQRIKPANFLLVAHDDPLVALPPGTDRTQMTPIAPFSREPSEWLALPWRNRFDGARLHLTTKRTGEAGRIRVRTYGDVVTDYRLHPDPKTAASDGGPVLRGTVGVLMRRPVRVTGIRYVGKETARQIDEESGMLRLGDEPFTSYEDPAAEWEQVRRELRRCRDAGFVTIRQLAQAAGLSERAVQYNLNRGRGHGTLWLARPLRGSQVSSCLRGVSTSCAHCWTLHLFVAARQVPAARPPRQAGC